MMASDEKPDEQLAQRRAAAERQLWSRMEERGMTREGGWRIAEVTRDTRAGTEHVLRPMHVWHDSPYDLEVVICARQAGAADDASVTPEPLRRDASGRRH
jgi:hypothetical protein